MKIREAIVLAGGLGTRLRSAVAELPKAMAPVASHPFISYVVDYLRMQGIERFVFSLGYKAEVIQQYLDEKYPTLQYEVVVEEEPLGTGGGISLGLSKTVHENIVIINGDTLFKIKLSEVAALHQLTGAECTLALKRLRNFDRYGAVTVDEKGKITSFDEKRFYAEGFINGGVYLLNKTSFLQRQFPQKYSFEKDYLEQYTAAGRLYGVVQEDYFIDIGIPEDYNRAQEDLKARPPDYTSIDKTWTLFLDRDGVINDERPGEYILQWAEFKFSTGVLEAFKILSEKFGRIIIITNQRGVGKGLMSEDDLTYIHQQMRSEVEKKGGRIDGIYYCTDTDNKCFYRKPNPGMALQAVTDCKDIDLSKAIMVGNKPSDVRFGRTAGMFTVFVTTTNPDQVFPHPDIDSIYPTLLQFAAAIQS